MKYGILYDSLAHVAKDLKEQLNSDKIDVSRLVVAVQLLFGEKLLCQWLDSDDPIAHIKSALHENMMIFLDAEETGLCLITRIIALNATGALENLDWGHSVNVERDKENLWYAPGIECIAYAIGISPMVFYRCLEALLEKEEDDT